MKAFMSDPGAQQSREWHTVITGLSALDGTGECCYAAAVREARAILAQSEPTGDEAFFSDPYSAPCAPGRNGGDFYSGFYNDGCQGEAHVNLMHAIRRALDSGAFDAR